MTNYEVRSFKIITLPNKKRRFIGYFESYQDLRDALTSEFSIKKKIFKWSKVTFKGTKRRPTKDGKPVRSPKKSGKNTASNPKDEKKPVTQKKDSSKNSQKQPKISKKKSRDTGRKLDDSIVAGLISLLSKLL